MQALGLLGVIGLTVPGYIDYLTRPLVCYGWCLDFRDLPFLLSVTALGPAIVLLLILAWRWRRPRRWPLLVLAVVSVWAVAVTAVYLASYSSGGEPAPATGLLPVFVILPSLVTTVLGARLVWPLPWKPLVGVSAAGSVLLAALVATNVIGPVHQEIPGELSLPFSKKVVYEGRDTGCSTWVAGWTTQHECINSTLVVYRGSGDWSADEARITRILVSSERLPPGDYLVGPPPVDVPAGQRYKGGVDARNRGMCVAIVDRVSAGPATPAFGHCASAAVYSDIRANWPENDAYAIGILYWYWRPD